jgi:ATP-dependent RNA helicase HelY
VSARVDFEARLGFQLDDFQRRAFDALDGGRSVLVAAPTGSGKTLVAEYAIERSLAQGGKAFYTTPLKALSNQKYGDLVRTHGKERVGLLTGDNSINGEAPVVVMTTEVLRNMIYAASPTLDDLRVVVLDEVHYLQDRYRGAVWEEIIVHLAPDVGLVCLSATVSNAEEVAAWIETVRGETTPVIEERRPVLLQHRYLVGERDGDALHLLPTFVGEGDDLRPNPEAERLDRRAGRRQRGQPAGSRRLRTPSRVEVADLLAAQDLLPAIVFVFSRAGCDQAVDQCRAAGVRLTTADERAQIRAIAEAHVAALDDDDLAVLGYDAWLAGLEAGLAAHHAGMVPPMKEAVEEAFAAGLAKLVFATETLALGINMPARSVVIEKLTKFTGERHDFLTPGEYTQLTGRAGRRGIDAVGYAMVLWSPWVGFDQVAGLAARRTDALRSSFRPTYNMAVNLVRRYPPETAHRLLNLSFAQYHADREVVALERQLERTRELLERQRGLAASPYGDLAEYRRLVERLDGARRGGGAARRIGRALESLRPGDVVWIGARGGKVLVLSQEARRGNARLLGLTTSRQLVRLGPSDFSSPPVAIGRLDLPVPYAPRTRAFQREAVDALRRVRGQGSRRASEDDDVAALESEVAEHPVAQDPERDARLRAAAGVQRLERELARLERRVRGRSESLARQLDRVLGVLESWGYLRGWQLTEAGEMLARVYTETDLLLAESVREGLLDALTPPELAALVSCFTYERRGADGAEPAPPGRWPSKAIAARARDIERLWRSLVANEDDAGLPETRPPDPGFTPYVFEWCRGDDLAAILDTDELTGGDFVRHVKQCIDLLRQIADIAPEPSTRRTAHDAASSCHRGVVAAGLATA